MTPDWLRILLTRKMLICVFTGFSSGLPLFLLLNLLPAWLALLAPVCAGFFAAQLLAAPNRRPVR